MSIHDQAGELEKQPPAAVKTAEEMAKELQVDIEHVPVEDDPREWSMIRKVSHIPLAEFLN
jgi:hypothetical protein